MVADRTDAITVKADMAPVICVDDRGGQLAVFPHGWIEYSRGRIGFWAHDIAAEGDAVEIYPADATIYKQNLWASKWKPHSSFYEGETVQVKLQKQKKHSAEDLLDFWQETSLNR